MKLIACLILIGLATSGFSATSKTIPELYKLNNGSFTSDYSVTYNNPPKSGDFEVVSEAGDINNDGIPDLLLGNPNYDNNRGIVYVIYGKPGSLRQFNSMDDFQPSDGFIIRGAADGYNFGSSVSAAGDVNGDGIDDIIIGTAPWNPWYNSPDFPEVPVAYVLFGRKSSSEFPSFVEVNRLNSTQVVKILLKCRLRQRTTFTISGGGDVNGDGVNDIVVGHPDFQTISVYYGSKQGLTDMKSEPEAGKGFTVDSNEYSLGGAVSIIGDFNGDGVDDLVFGSSRTARALLVFGRREGFPKNIKQDYFLNKNYALVIIGDLQRDDFGCSVSRAGDFNGDGLQDVIIGAPGANSQKGVAYLILGSRENTGALLTSRRDFTRGFTMMSMTSVNSQLGRRVSGGRDLNGDGLSDIILPAPGLNNEKGAVYVIYGSNSSLANMQLDDMKSNQGYVMYGAKEGDKFGYISALVKDVNSDGMNDLFVGAPGGNGGQGAAYLFYTPWKCSTNCASCSKPDTCEACASGFGFLGGNCVACPSETHTWVDGKCKVKCSANCASCSRPNTCESCAQGYGMLNGECTICNPATHILTGGFCIGKCTQNCAFCVKPGSCDHCTEGFGFLGNVCTRCPSSTHFLNHGICQEKRPRCIQWSGPDSCEACAPGFGFLNGECITCPDTHTLNNGTCQAKCPENCAQCTKPNLCDACSEGFGFLNNACVICPEKTHFLDNGICHEDRDAWKQIKDLFDEVFHKKN